MNVIYLYKAVGAVLVIFAGIYISLDYSRAVRGELSAAKDAEKLVRHIRDSITYGGGNVRDIISSYCGACGAFSADLPDNSHAASGGSPTAEIWRRASETSLSDALKIPNLPFDSATLGIMTEFASQLGRGYREPQTELCRATESRLAARISELESSKKDRLRVSSAICIFVCLSLVILLL